jgi:hypothetical protein
MKSQLKIGKDVNAEILRLKFDRAAWLEVTRKLLRFGVHRFFTLS